jgi:hypothetical protein
MENGLDLVSFFIWVDLVSKFYLSDFSHSNWSLHFSVWYVSISADDELYLARVYFKKKNILIHSTKTTFLL